MRGGEGARGRFIELSKEYINLAKVGKHPHVLRFFGVGIVDGVPYLVTELAEGGSLQEKIEAGDATDAEKIKWALDVARGMSHIHSEGFIHRDLKPDNVLLKGDRADIIPEWRSARRRQISHHEKSHIFCIHEDYGCKIAGDA